MNEGGCVGLDVQARSVVAGVIDLGSGEVRSLRVPPGARPRWRGVSTRPSVLGREYIEDSSFGPATTSTASPRANPSIERPA